ncbi:TPA: hypothetical protein JDH29_000355 [Salmonella enterica subsp. houtenae]|nr:hypothetical protein [Salmonella enterica subsp. houtenae]
MSDTNDLEWRVIQSVCIGEGEYLLILDGTEIKIMARALATHPINPTDILSPTREGMYIVNDIYQQMVKFFSATELNTAEWHALAL